MVNCKKKFLYALSRCLDISLEDRKSLHNFLSKNRVSFIYDVIKIGSIEYYKVSSELGFLFEISRPNATDRYYLVTLELPISVRNEIYTNSLELEVS